MDSLLDFTGKTAIVTGGRRGLGKAMAADARIGLQKTTENPLKNQFRIFLSWVFTGICGYDARNTSEPAASQAAIRHNRSLRSLLFRLPLDSRQNLM